VKTETALNGICPYFTMFPLDFPLGILKKYASQDDTVLDPFCGRGTTNYAARLLGLSSLGIDSSPVSTAITASKLVHVTAEEILEEAKVILKTIEPRSIPDGEFWLWAYHSEVLESICRYRTAFLDSCNSAPRIALRGILLGALHGPRQKTFPSYFSNQCPRTYAPKPAYSVRYWQEKKLFPEPVNVLEIIERRTRRYFNTSPSTTGTVRQADSRNMDAFKPCNEHIKFKWVITSPPYYGMRTYIPDQWLRNWFVGGPATVDYNYEKQLAHSSPEEFAEDLRKVWKNSYLSCDKNASMVIRFGGITERNIDPLTLIRRSIEESGWRIQTTRKAGNASAGKRQADTFLRNRSKPIMEYDVWAIK